MNCIFKCLLFFFQVNFKNFLQNDRDALPSKSLTASEETSYTDYEANLDKQLQAWKSNPTWSDKPPEMKVNLMIMIMHEY